MKKFILIIMAALIFSAGIATANSTDQIQQFQQNTIENAPKVEEEFDPSMTMDTRIKDARAEFVNLSNEITTNAKQVRYLGAHWSAAHTEQERLKFLQGEAAAKAQAYAEDVQKIVAIQQGLSQRTLVLIKELSLNMTPEQFQKLRHEVIIPKAIELETMKQTSVNFIHSMENGHKQVMSNTEHLTIESHIDLTAYDKKQIKKFLALTGQ